MNSLTRRGRANYHAFQFQWDKRFSGGLAYQVSYTYSKSIDIGCSGWYGVEGCSVTDPYHLNNSRGVSGFDLTHVLSISGVYDLPIGRGRLVNMHNRLLNYVLGNWQLNGIYLARSGLPYNAYVGADVANTGNLGGSQYERANLVGDPHVDHSDREKWFNTSAFEVPALYTFGNLGRNRFRSAAYWNMDTSVFRNFPFGEGKRVEFRVEAFNVANTVIYGTPHNDMTDPDFGKVTWVANTPRILQFAARVVF